VCSIAVGVLTVDDVLDHTPGRLGQPLATANAEIQTAGRPSGVYPAFASVEPRFCAEHRNTDAWGLRQESTIVASPSLLRRPLAYFFTN